MRLFSSRKTGEADAISAFWLWWDTVREDVATAVAAGGVDRFAAGLSSRVNAINKDLHWELAPGQSSAHALVVTAAGDPALRSVAARWLGGAPAADETWSYRSVRTADPTAFEATMQLGGQTLALADIRYSLTVDQDRHQIDVTCYHPAFDGLPEDARGQVTFLTLDWALGEDDVEIWLRDIDWTTTEPQDPRTPRDLQQAVAAVAADDSWALMHGQKRDGTPIMAVVASPLRSARWPRFDLHIPVGLPYRGCNDRQLPDSTSLDALRAFEDELTAALGGDGALVAHETSGRVRTLHYYVDSRSTARATVKSRLPQWREGRVSVTPRMDPAFDNVRHLMR
ncbi:MAG: DUF695 domain-containing protein [Streptomycetaceae bacterium]|nr:DUF695 domain-containing protein [Streptomycetaceae bacterium]